MKTVAKMEEQKVQEELTALILNLICCIYIYKSSFNKIDNLIKGD